MTPLRVKICGLTRREDAEVASAAGAAYGGVILARGGARSISPERAAAVFAGSRLTRVGVFVDADEAEVLSSARSAGLQVVQLHGGESPSLAAALRGAGLTVWKALRPRAAEELLGGIERYGGSVDGILLDGWSPRAPGGTGSVFDWEAAASHRAAVPGGVDLIVAGGLDPENVTRAAALLRPTTVDVSSGVETEPGIKDHRLIRAFVGAAASIVEDR